MEPPSLDGGDAVVRLARVPLICSLQWSRRLSTAETSVEHGTERAQLGRFNGAAVSRRRRPCGTRSTLAWSAGLQWSRRLSTAETRFVVSRSSPDPAALQWSRRLSTAETFGPSTTTRSWISRFNGAAVSRRRRRESRHALPVALSASMEPPSLDGGDRTVRAGSRTRRIPPLQWSRRLSTAETVPPPAISRSRRWIGFNGAAVSRRRRPRSGGRLAGLEALELQWSRRLSTAETSRAPAANRPTPQGFNGAAVSRRRRPAAVSLGGQGTSRFNGAAVSRRRRLYTVGPKDQPLTPQASMEPPSLDGGD